MGISHNICKLLEITYIQNSSHIFFYLNYLKNNARDLKTFEFMYLEFLYPQKLALNFSWERRFMDLCDIAKSFSSPLVVVVVGRMSFVNSVQH